jgi:uncharacterized protein YkwD
MSNKLRRGTQPVCCALLALAAACGGGHPPATASSLRRYLPQGAASATYRTAAQARGAIVGPHADELSPAIERVLSRASQTCEPDARLGQLALWIAATLDGGGSPPPSAVIDLWTRQLGLVEPTPHFIVLGQPDALALQARAADELAGMLRRQRYTHYGVATHNQGGGAFAVLVLSWRLVELRPIPRSVAVGASLKLVGSLRPGVHAPQLVVSFPDGTSHRGPREEGSRVALDVPLRGRGEHRVELLANSELGITVVANFPIYVGVPPAREITVAVASSSPQAMDETAAKRQFLELINDERKRGGLGPLAGHERLDRVARAHSADMHEHGFVGHTSKTTGSAEDRVARSGLRTTLVLENIGRGYSPEEVHRGLVDSPGHRANLVHPQATHVGIGVVLTREDDRFAYLVTQLFIRLARKIEIGEARADLLGAIARARARRGAAALKVEGELSELCAATARDFFSASKPTHRQLLDRLNRQASARRTPYSRMAAVLTVVSSIDEASEIEALLDPRARALGLGLAQGTRPDTVENAIAIVALIAH